MMTVKESGARAVADLNEKLVLASVEIAASPQRVFKALTSEEIVDWWVRERASSTPQSGAAMCGWAAAGVPPASSMASPMRWKGSISSSTRRESSCTLGVVSERRVPRPP